MNREEISKGKPYYHNAEKHITPITYRESCLCGQVSRETTEQSLEEHKKASIVPEGAHTVGKGHALYYKCSVCKGSIYTGEFVAYSKSYASFCSICRIMALQHRLVEYWGESIGTTGIDGKCGAATLNAVNAVRKRFDLNPVNYLDTESYDLVMNGIMPQAEDTGKCSHEWGEPYYKDGHPHNKVFTCKKCGYLYETADIRYFEDCCNCVGHLYNGDDYSLCLRCGKTAEQIEEEVLEQNPEAEVYVPCEHMTEVKYSEHPHIRAYYECTVEGCPKYGVTIELDDQFSPAGREFSWCSKCFPQDRIDNEHTLSMAILSQQTYNMGSIIDSVADSMSQNGEYRNGDYSLSIEKTGSKGIYKVTGEVPIDVDDASSATRFVNGLRTTEASGFPDGFIEVDNTTDGELVVTISFEGSQELEDWIITNANTRTNDDGVHTGFANLAKDYIYGIFNGDFYIQATVNGVYRQYRLSDLLGELQDNPKAHLRITGHSLGGAVAQCLAYYLVKGDLYKISSEQIEVYTYASPIPFSYQAIEDDKYREMNVYNFINVNDFVPDVGVSISDGIILRVAEEGGALVANQFKEDGINGGASVAGTNLGKNIYVSSDKLANWNGSVHAMKETYLPLVKGYIDGSIPSYLFDTDIFFSEYYDLSGHKALESVVKVGENIVKALKISEKTVEVGTNAYYILDNLGMLD